MNKIIKIIPFVVSLFCFIYADNSVESIIKDKDKVLQQTLKTYRSTPNDSNRQKVINIVNSVFDFSIMGQKAIPKTVWDKATKESQTSFVKQFRRMIELSSVRKLEMYQSDSIHYDPTISDESKATVTAHVWYKGKQIVMQYKMIKNNTTWKAWDLVVDDLSTIRTYKEQFTNYLQTKTLDELIEVLKKKADSLQ